MGRLEGGQPAAGGLGLLVWPLAWGSRARRERMEQRGRSLSPASHGSDSQMDTVGAGQQGRGLLGDLGLGLQVGISIMTWKTVNLRQ